MDQTDPLRLGLTKLRIDLVNLVNWAQGKRGLLQNFISLLNSKYAETSSKRYWEKNGSVYEGFGFCIPWGRTEAIWRIENFRPVSFPKSLNGKFFTRDAYIVLATTVSKSGALHHDVHYWLGKDTSQDEAGTAAIKTVELDAILGGRAVQYREVQGQETEKFLSYFKPCIIPQKCGVASGFRHVEVNSYEHETRLYVCKGKHVVYVKEVPFTRSSLNHDDVFLLDTKSKVFQFNGSNSSIQERAKGLEVVQYIRDAHHDGKCEVAVMMESSWLMLMLESSGLFLVALRLFIKEQPQRLKMLKRPFQQSYYGKTTPIETDLLTRELLESNKCYMIDCGVEVFVWMGRYTSLDDRKSASATAEGLVQGPDRQNTHVIRIIEGFETVMFQSKFDSWPETSNVAASEDGCGKVAALLKLQGIDVKGLMKSDPVKEEPEPCIDSSGILQVWRIDGNEKALLSSSEQSKLYTGDCYAFHYTSPGEEGEEYLIGTWFGKKSIEEERADAISIAYKMALSCKSRAVQVHIFEGREPPQFCAIFQRFIVFKGGYSSGYKKFISEGNIVDDTYKEDGTALFRVQGLGPDIMQAIQVDAVASSLNSSYCFILQACNALYTWAGNLTTSEDHDLLERQLDLIKPNLQYKPLKEGAETEQFWDLLGGKREHPTEKFPKQPASDPHLFFCSCSQGGGTLKVNEVFNFTQDDLMTEDIYILDCQSDIFVWVGQQVDSKSKLEALNIGKKFLERDFLMEKLSRETPIFIVTEGSEPQYFTRFFSWDSSKSAAHGNSYQRKLAIVKHGVTPIVTKSKRLIPTYSGRSILMDKSQRSRSVSSTADRHRPRGRSPAFNAIASTFENLNSRNFSTPPAVEKIYPKSSLSDTKTAPRSAAIAALTSSFESAAQSSGQPLSKGIDLTKNFSFIMIFSFMDCNNEFTREVRLPVRTKAESSDNGSTLSGRIANLTISEDAKEEVNDEEDLPTYPYERLITSSTDPVTDIDVTKREAYLSSIEFKAKFNMSRSAFYKLPKWKQNKLKTALNLF
ncbi:hypothetical protein IEQ34_008452 [Dendrobium chrysotoxum]|uniref:HP domain-containing protein n=1 Tax=Dendrobium chrysotoxum TaxID=161865 RepID=A0AAV7GZ80_DENCH|nr:hypothetical protein IEQ34_008452 [Dendrobium chrysotoxum]